MGLWHHLARNRQTWYVCNIYRYLSDNPCGSKKGLVHEANHEAEQASAAPPRSTDGQASTSLVAHRVTELTLTLNNHGEECRDFLLDICSDHQLKSAGRYDPSIGQGVEDEMDPGNFAGSILLLAMIKPHICGMPDAPVLNIFGTPPPESLTVLAEGPPRSGKGPDNRRTNAIEALLNHWQDNARCQVVRAQLLDTWKLVRMTTSVLSWRMEWGWPWIVSERCTEVIRCQVSLLPQGPIPDQCLEDFEKVSANVKPAKALNLMQIPCGAATNASIASSVGMSKGGKVVPLIRWAIWRCEEAGVEHGGDLLKLFFPPSSPATPPPSLPLLPDTSENL